MRHNKKILALAGAGLITLSVFGVAVAEQPNMNSIQATSANLFTTDHQATRTPDEISVFDAKKVRTPHRFVNLLSQDNIAELNTTIEKVIRDYGKNEKKPVLANFKGNLINDINFYQLQGKDGDGHHVAYVIETNLSPKVIPLLNMDEPLFTLPYLPESAYVDSLRVAAKNDAEFGKTAAERNAKFADEFSTLMEKALSEGFKENEEMAKKLNVKPFTEREKEILKAYYKSLSVRFLAYQPKQEVQTSFGKALYSQARAAVGIDGFELPISNFDIERYTNEGIIFTTVMVNDSSFPYWEGKVKQIWGIK